MCGAFNHVVGQHVSAALREGPTTRLVAVGNRVVVPCRQAGYVPEVVLRAPSVVEGLTGAVYEVLVEIERRPCDQVVLLHQRPEHPSGIVPATMQLLPLSPARMRRLAMHPWGSRVLPSPWPPEAHALVFEALLRQYVFMTLYRALASSLAAELTARMLAMESAEKNIEERQGKLLASLQRARQERITDELLEVISGFEVLETRSEA
ncbi:MAG: F0F1 ATP synthase subunit gamma [Candidatus Xenobia bacterium]